MAAQKTKQKKTQEKFSLEMEEGGLCPIPASFKRPKPKKRYTAAEKEMIKAGRELLEDLQKLKQQAA